MPLFGAANPKKVPKKVRKAIREVLGSLGTFCTSISIGRGVMLEAITSAADLRMNDADIETCEGRLALAKMVASYWGLKDAKPQEALGELIFQELASLSPADQVDVGQKRILRLGLTTEAVVRAFDLLTQGLALSLGKLLPPTGVSRLLLTLCILG